MRRYGQGFGQFGFLSHAFVEHLNGELWRLSQPLIYRSKIGKTIIVPAGLVFDGASIPRAVWSLLPSKSECIEEGALHDWLYRVGPSLGVNRSEADYLIWEALDLSADGWRAQRWAIWAALKLGGWVAWRRWRKLDLSAESARAAWVYRPDGEVWA